MMSRACVSGLVPTSLVLCLCVVFCVCVWIVSPFCDWNQGRMAALHCSVCLECYDHVDHRPHVLTCGHSTCTSCLKGLLKGHLLCPTCRTTHKVKISKVEDIAINYALLSLIQQKARETIDHDDIIRSLKKETTDTTSYQIATLEDQIEKLNARLLDLAEQSELTEKVMKDTGEFLKYLERMHEKVEDEINFVQEAIREAETEKVSLWGHQRHVLDAATLRRVITAEDAAKRCCGHIEAYIQWNNMLLTRKVLENAHKVLSQSEAFLANFEDQMADPRPAPLTSQHPARTMKPKKVAEVSLPLVKEVLRRGKLVAMHISEGRSRCAQITQEGERILLHVLKDGEPHGAFAFAEYDSVRLLQEGEMTVFLELSWGGEVKGKVFIKTEGIGRQTFLFRHLCLGDRGPSYLNTPLMERDHKGWPCVKIQTNKDSVTSEEFAKLFTTNGICYFQCNPLRAGAVGVDRVPECSFYICTSAHSGVNITDYTVGFVDADGLKLVDEAFGLPDISEATISDCGLVLSP